MANYYRAAKANLKFTFNQYSTLAQLDINYFDIILLNKRNFNINQKMPQTFSPPYSPKLGKVAIQV